MTQSNATSGQSDMQLEVELKFAVEDREALTAALGRLGCTFQQAVDQADLYFAHPIRSFRQTDEALRLRRSGESACITYKGPKLDAATKTRREIELPLAGGHADFDQLREMLELLGFAPVLEVRKTRLPGTLVWDGASVEIALDQVAGLGTYVELEEFASPDELPLARGRLLSLAEALGLSNSERRGYLDLLLQK